jgi:hypothetical protein
MAEGGGNADERLIVMLEARISEFEKRMAKAERTGTKTYQGLQRGSSMATRRMEADMIAASGRINQALASVQGRVGTFSKAFAGALLAGGLAAFTSGLRSAIGSIADMADDADRIGLTVQKFQELQYGMKLAGVGRDEFASGLAKFTDNIGDAARGTGTFRDLLIANGIQLRTASGEVRSTSDLLGDFADLIQRVPDEATRMSMITEAFGRGGKAMTLALEGGSAGLKDMGIAAQDAGAVMDEQVVARARELDDSFDKLTTGATTFFMEAAVGWAGLISDVTSYVAEVANLGGGLDKIFGSRERAAEILGKDLADKLAASDTLMEQNATLIGESASAVTDLGQQAREAAGQVELAAMTLGALGGDTKASEALSEISLQMLDLVKQFEIGTIGVDDYKIGLTDLTGKAIAAMRAVDGINGISLNDAISVVSGLGGVLDGLAVKARLAASAVALAVGGGGSGDAGVGAGASASGSFTLKKTTAGSAGKGGSGGGTGKLDAVLRDLQTEREAVTAWYAEASALLATATDAQLMQVGGRHEALERLETEHQERLRGIRDVASGGALANAETFFGGMATLAAAGGSKMVKVQRVAAAAEALINTYRAQAAVLATPGLTVWQRFAAYAAIGAAGMGVVSALGGSGKSKGGGTSGGGAESAGSASASTAEAAQSPLVVTLQGLDPKKLYEGSQIIALADALQKEFGKRGLQVGVPA